MPKAKYKNKSTHLLSPVKSRYLNNFEKESFEIEHTNSSFTINTSNRLFQNNHVFHSINYTKTTKRSSYVIKFSCENKLEFGEIVYFFNFDNHFYACVKLYEIVTNNIFNNLKGRKSKQLKRMFNNNYFSEYFYLITKTDTILLINTEKIISKCFIYNSSDNNYFITEYSFENEHD